MTTNHVATITDEMRESLDRMKSIVATAEAESRELTATEKAEVAALTERMQSLDTRRTVHAHVGTFDELVGQVRGAPGLRAQARGAIPGSGYGGSSAGAGDTLGAQLVGSEQFRTFLAHLGHGRPVSMSPVELRAATPYLPPGPSYAPGTIAPPAVGSLPPWGQATVAGLFPSLPAQGGSISYLRDVRTGLEAGIPATGTAAGTAKPETVLAPQTIEQALIVLATWSKVANTVPEDVTGFAAWVDAILAAGVYDAEAAYIINTILGVAGILTVTPTAGTPVADALLDAAMQVQTRSDLPATGAIVAPNVFTALATAKASTSGVYLSGLPLSAAPSMTLWGQLQIVVSAAKAAGTALVVAGRAGAVYRRGTLRVDVSDSNEDDFIKNLLTVRVEERVAFATYKPVGFASVTGLVAP